MDEMIQSKEKEVLPSAASKAAQIPVSILWMEERFMSLLQIPVKTGREHR